MGIALSINIIYQIDNNNKIVFLQSFRYVGIGLTILEVEEMDMKPGLEGVAAAETKISLVDGKGGG